MAVRSIRRRQAAEGVPAAVEEAAGAAAAALPAVVQAAAAAAVPAVDPAVVAAEAAVGLAVVEINKHQFALYVGSILQWPSAILWLLQHVS